MTGWVTLQTNYLSRGKIIVRRDPNGHITQFAGAV